MPAATSGFGNTGANPWGLYAPTNTGSTDPNAFGGWGTSQTNRGFSPGGQAPGGQASTYGGVAMQSYGNNASPGFTQKVGFMPDAWGASQVAQQRMEAARQFDVGQAGATQRTNIAANAQMYPATLRQQRFNQLLPLLNGQLSQSPYTIGGQSPASPEITVGPIWNDQQQQQQVNAARASNDASAQSAIRQQQQSLGGQGFGANSPLAQALAGQTMAANQATNTANERDIRMNAQGQNAQHVLSTQQAREAQFAQRQQESIQRAQPYFARQNALIAALAGLGA